MPLRRLSSSPHSIGGRSRQITLYQPGGRNATDGGNLPPNPVFTVWGSIRTPKGEEWDRAQQIAQEVQHIIGISYQTGVTQDMLAGFENRMFQIRFILDEDEMHWSLDLYCSEIGQNAGSQT